MILEALAGTNAAFEPVVLRQSLSQVSAADTGGAVSADGRLVAVVSMERLLPVDQNTVTDVYVLNRQTGVITLETVAVDGAFANGSSARPQLSGDGRHLAFESLATNLTSSPDRNDGLDVFVRDRQLGTTTRVSVGRAGEDANGKSDAPAISRDGSFVAFVSNATNLVPGADPNGTAGDVYRFCLATGETTRVGVDTAGRSYQSSFAPRLSGDGSLVVFGAIDGAQTDPATNARRAVYVRDITAGVTSCVSCDRDAGSSGRPAFTPDISADGQTVVFAVFSGPYPERTDIAVHDRFASRTIVITRQANARSAAPRLSGDGRMIVFESWASDLLCYSRCSEDNLDDNLLPDVYLFDRESARFRRVSGGHRVWWSPSRGPAIDGGGRTVVFSSRQPYGPEDATADYDLFVCDPICH
jgi:Tol biopolymer transport system component